MLKRSQTDGSSVMKLQHTGNCLPPIPVSSVTVYFVFWIIKNLLK